MEADFKIETFGHIRRCAQRIRSGQLLHQRKVRVFALLTKTDHVIHRGHDRLCFFAGFSGEKCMVLVTVEHFLDQFVLFQQHLGCKVRIDLCRLLVAFRVLMQRFFKFSAMPM